MTGGLVGFGVGVLIYALVLRRVMAGFAWSAATICAVATLGVAALPLDAAATIDGAHTAAAVVGYLALAATPLLAARPLAEGGHRGGAATSVAVSVVAAACLVATAVGPAHGLFQRVGLGLVDAWLVVSAVWIAGGGETAGPG